MKRTITEEEFNKYAKEQGWYYTILYESISFRIDKKKCPSNMLSVIRKCFSNYYVGKDSYGKDYRFKIYCGDKETNKFLNQPIKGFGPINKRKFISDCIEDLKKGLKK